MRRAARYVGFFSANLEHPDQLAGVVATVTGLRRDPAAPYDLRHCVLLPPLLGVQGLPAGPGRRHRPHCLVVFPADLVQPPRSWAERSYHITRYTRMDRRRPRTAPPRRHRGAEGGVDADEGARGELAQVKLALR